MCVLDSGASKSLVSQEFADNLGMTVDDGSNCSLLAAYGRTMESVGTVTLTVGVGQEPVLHTFVVVKEFVFPVLLGSDFLAHIEAVLDYGKGTVALGKDASVCLPIRSVLSNWPYQKKNLDTTEGRTCVLTSVAPEPVTLSSEAMKQCTDKPVSRILLTTKKEESEPDVGSGAKWTCNSV